MKAGAFFRIDSHNASLQGSHRQRGFGIQVTEVSRKRGKEPRLDDFTYNFRAPELNPQRADEIERAARAYGERNASDPFAYSRMLCHMKRGIENPQEVVAALRGVVLE